MKFLEIHDKYNGRIKRFIFSTVKDAWVADDLTQETFIKMKNKRKNYSHRFPMGFKSILAWNNTKWVTAFKVK